MARNSGRFHFDGGAATYVGTAILGLLITVFTLGICYPFALVLNQRWRAKHSYIDGQRLTFTGTGIGLFGTWIKWFLLIVITIGIYAFWVGPRIARWKWEHTDFDPTWRPNTLDQSQPAVKTLSPVAPRSSGLLPPALGHTASQLEQTSGDHA
ncbi:MAG: DUF898 family protein [Nocardioidaceae bacterium]